MRTVLMMILAGATIACGGSVNAPSDAVGKTWRLVSIQEGDAPPTSVQNSSRYTLRLEDGGRVSVMSDCNSCGGTYTLDGSALELQGLACTRVGCGDGSLDPAYARALEGTKTATIDDEDLVISGNGVTLRFGR